MTPTSDLPTDHSVGHAVNHAVNHAVDHAVDLTPAAQRMVDLVAAVPDDLLPAPTPCPGTPVEAMLSHVLGLAHAFTGAARKAPDAGPPPAEHPPLPADWRTALPTAVLALAAAWREPDAQTGMTAAGGLDLPGEVAALVALDELTVHGWDLARATGLPYRPDPTSVAGCLAFVEPTAQPGGVPGLFGPPVPVPADAPALDRLLGLTGRDPAWQPPG